MRVLVTGGAGFIGSHVVARLVADGWQVRVLDDLSSGSLENLADVGGSVELLRGDVADPADAVRAVGDCQAVVHLAAVASVEVSVRQPLLTNRVNLVGTITLLEAAARAGAHRVVYASSAAVYGEADELPIREDAPKRPLSPYAADKLAGEHYLAHYHRQGLLDGAAFRFFNVYGPRQDPSSPYSGVISIFLERVSRGQRVALYGDGGQTRDFVYVADVVEAIVRALRAPSLEAGRDLALGRGRELRVANLGRGVSVDLLTLLEDVAAVCGRSGQVEVDRAPRRAGDIAHSRADITRLRELYDWAPSTPLRTGLAATLAAAQRPVEAGGDTGALSTTPRD